ncbi:shTK domain protein [Trichuris suis]|nr:shTK domain protein [Trichuris suis]
MECIIRSQTRTAQFLAIPKDQQFSSPFAVASCLPLSFASIIFWVGEDVMEQEFLIANGWLVVYVDRQFKQEADISKVPTKGEIAFFFFRALSSDAFGFSSLARQLKSAISYLSVKLLLLIVSDTCQAVITKELSGRGTQAFGNEKRESLGSLPSLEKPCMDSNQFCCFWAFFGECEKNSAFMKTRCQKSCGTCSCKESDKSLCEANVNVEGCKWIPKRGEEGLGKEKLGTLSHLLLFCLAARNEHERKLMYNLLTQEGRVTLRWVNPDTVNQHHHRNLVHMVAKEAVCAGDEEAACSCNLPRFLWNDFYRLLRLLANSRKTNISGSRGFSIWKCALATCPSTTACAVIWKPPFASSAAGYARSTTRIVIWKRPVTSGAAGASANLFVRTYFSDGSEVVQLLITPGPPAHLVSIKQQAVAPEQTPEFNYVSQLEPNYGKNATCEACACTARSLWRRRTACH